MKDPLEESAAEVSRGGAARVLLSVVLGFVALYVFVPGSRIPLLIVGGIILLVMLHEAGHYFAAKRTGMKVTEFFLGFGPRLWSFRRGETEYGVKALPLGGYVRIIGMTSMDEVDPADEARTYRQARYRNRMFVVLAGVTVNLLIAFVLFTIVIAGNGVAQGPSTTVATVSGGSAAEAAGLQEGDRIVAVDGQAAEGWDELVAAIQARPHEDATITIERDGRTIDLEATIGTRNGQGFLGVGPSTEYESVGLLAAVPKALDTMWDATTGTGRALARHATPDGVSEYGRNFTSEAPKAGSTADLERPRSIVGIVDQGSDIVGDNLWVLLSLIGLLSLILALFNLLPIPLLDGGHAAIVVFEWAASKVKHRKVEVDYRKVAPIGAVALALLFAFSLSVMALDVRDVIGR